MVLDYIMRRTKGRSREIEGMLFIVVLLTMFFFDLQAARTSLFSGYLVLFGCRRHLYQ